MTMIQKMKKRKRRHRGKPGKLESNQALPLILEPILLACRSLVLRGTTLKQEIGPLLLSLTLQDRIMFLLLLTPLVSLQLHLYLLFIAIFTLLYLVFLPQARIPFLRTTLRLFISGQGQRLVRVPLFLKVATPFTPLWQSQPAKSSCVLTGVKFRPNKSFNGSTC